MLTNLDQPRPNRQSNSHHSTRRHRQMHHGELSHGGHDAAEQGSTLSGIGGARAPRNFALSHTAPADRGAVGGSGQGHLAVQAGIAQALAEGFAYCFLGGPEVEERLQFVGLSGHPVELRRGEPAPGHRGHFAGVLVLDVDTDRAVLAGRDGDQFRGVADAHPQPGQVGTAELVVPQDGTGVEQGLGEVEQKFVGSKPLIAAGWCQPDVHGGQIGARTLIHRKKVSR